MVITLDFVVGSLIFMFFPTYADWQIQAAWAFLLAGLLAFGRAIWPQGLWHRLSDWIRTIEIAGTGLFFMILGVFAVAFMGGTLGGWTYAFAGLFLVQGLGMVLWTGRNRKRRVAPKPTPSAEDLRTMRLFNEKANKLRRSSFAREMATKPTGVTISWKEGDTEPKADIRGPDEESVDSMVLTLRLVEQNNEPYSLHNMARLYTRLPTESKHKDAFLDARAKLNAGLDQVDPSIQIVYQRRDPTTQAVVKSETLTQRRILDLVVYGEKAHTNREKEAIVRSLRTSKLKSVLLDNEFNVVAARVLDGIFYLQIQNAALYEEVTGEKLAIDWPDEGSAVLTPPLRGTGMGHWGNT